MSVAMPLIRVREKNQVTLPREVVDFLRVQPSGHVEYKILSDGVLIQSLQQPVKEDKLAKIRRLSKSGRGVYRSADEVEAFINSMRDE
jgi:bifunctional DNA-binding transcriptional regulator/antitoxin component of YhaV-PrlF toxin-antitoxin module